MQFANEKYKVPAPKRRRGRRRENLRQAHSSQNQLLRVEVQSAFKELHFAHGPLRLDVHRHFRPRLVIDRLDQYTERRRDGAVVRDVRLIPLVVQLLDPRRVARAPQHPVAPRRVAALLRGIVLGAVDVVLVRRRKRDGTLHERAQTNVGFHFFRQLVVDQQVLKRVLLDGRYDQVSAMVDSVVQVPTHLYMNSYALVVESCTPALTKTIS